MKKAILSFTLLLFLNTSFAQLTFEQWEDSLSVMLDVTRKTESIPKMETLNKEFTQTLKKVLQQDGAFDYGFPKLSKKMSTIASPDGAFRLFNWNIEDSYKEHNFYCLVMTFNKKENKYNIIELKDNFRRTFDAENKLLDHRSWYGALYYEIIPNGKNAKSYTLLGWNGNNQTSTKKIIEVLEFMSADKIKFGAPIFKYEKETKRRVVLEYSKHATVSLKYYDKKDDQRIVFDHLSPENPQAEGIKEFYHPDGTFNALVWKNGKWILEQDVDVRLDKKIKNFNNPRDLEKK
jgi:hypothetical protein